MIIGFTGTRKGMTAKQIISFRKVILTTASYGDLDLWHGGAEGADEQAHDICYGFFQSINILPCNSERWNFWNNRVQQRGYNLSRVKIDGVRLPLRRNDIIVDHADVMIATPAEENEVQRSGTWYTVRYARGVKRRIYIIMPSGIYTT